MSTHPTDSPARHGGAGLASSTTARAPRVLRRYCGFAEFDALDQMMRGAWLSQRERAELAAWRDMRRRRAWTMARYVGKQLVAEVVGAVPTDFPTDDDARWRRTEILSRDEAGRVNRPRVWRDGALQPWSLSISHSHRGVLAALVTDEGTSVGVDVADLETFSDGFVDLWFTPAERAWFHETQSSEIACFIWAAKEALYKACNTGESFAPREVEVRADGSCSYRGVPLAECRLQSWNIDGHLAVLATVQSAQFSNSPNG